MLIRFGHLELARLLPAGDCSSAIKVRNDGELIRAPAEEGIDRSLNLLKRLVWTRRRLQASLAINQKNRWVPHGVPLDVGDFPTEREKRISHWDLFHIVPLHISLFVRHPENNEPLMLPPLV